MSTLPPAGSIGLVRVRGLAGLLIRLGQWLNGDGSANYEHAFVLVSRGTNAYDSFIVEAEPGGCREVILAEYWGRKVLWLECPAEHSFDVTTAALSYVGIKYSAEDYIAIAAKRLDVRPWAARLRRQVVTSGHVICSQMADAAAAQGGWELFDHTWPGYVTPARLYHLVSGDARPITIR